jgi:2-oxoglutarate dehydrogenase complex dehydrogenase (E1) component-like enzyme
LNSSAVENGQEDSKIQEGLTLKDQEEPNSESTKRRSASRLLRAYRKVAYELNQMSALAKPKKEKERRKSLRLSSRWKTRLESSISNFESEEEKSSMRPYRGLTNSGNL